MQLHKIVSLLLALCLVPNATAFADQEGGKSRDLSLHGFGTLGLARSSSGNAEFIRELSQTHGIKDGEWSGRIDSIIGLQANWQAAPEWEFVGQVVSRLRSDNSHNPEMMLGFAKWEPDAQTTLRVGRMGADFMMRADSRLVGYSFTPVRPSVDFFGLLIFSHLDGADVVLGTPVGAGILRGKVFLGKTHEKTSAGWDTRGSPLHGMVLDYYVGNWHVRASMAKIRYASQFKAFGIHDQLQANGFTQALAAITTRDKSAHFFAMGGVYEDGPLILQGMINKIQQESDAFQDSQSGFFLASYRVGAVTPFAGISRWFASPQRYVSLPDPALDAAYQSVMSASHAEQTTYTLGMRWDAWRNVALKAQLDAIRGKPVSKFPYANYTADWSGKTNVLSLTMDFVF